MNCAYCDKEFTPQYANQAYCAPECRKEMAKQKHGYIRRSVLRQWAEDNKVILDLEEAIYMTELLEMLDERL